MSALAVQHAVHVTEPLVVASDILGPIEATTDDVVEFTRGVLGFPDCRRFILVGSPRDGFCWMQSLEHSTLTFVLVDPFRVVPEYSVDISPALTRELRASAPADVAVFAIVTLPAAEGEPWTANLQGPLIVNARTRRAVQHVIPDGPFGVRHPLPADAAV